MEEASAVAVTRGNVIVAVRTIECQKGFRPIA